jgi:hypothetical protein
MPVLVREFHEDKLKATPIRELGLSIAGSRLEPVVMRFLAEVEQAGVKRFRPHLYLSTEWGVPFGTISIAIPFYLAWPRLTELHEKRTGYVEGTSDADILRYLRHEMGHVVNYAYRLYERPDWLGQFGSITQPYQDDYRPEPFSHRYVRHLPGWYAQKHPDEDWAETFAVWMTPGRDWESEYKDWPVALGKLRYCQETMRQRADQEPAVRTTELDEAADDIPYPLEGLYQERTASIEPRLLLDGDLRSIFDDLAQKGASGPSRPAADLVRSMERELIIDIYRWTGHFPERTRWLLRHLAERAQRLGLTYPEARERIAMMALTTMVTTLAMNYVQHGRYVPEAERAG